MKRSAFQDYLAAVPSINRPRSSFNRRHKHTTAIWDDVIVPIFCEPILPGDSVNIGVNSFVRLNPTLTPIMDNVWQDIHFFFVPNRLVWNNWQKFNGEQEDPEDSTDFLIPQITTPGSGWLPYTLADYFGLPVNVAGMESISALPFRAYGLIFNEWYRDQNLQSSLNVPKGDGPDDPTSLGYPSLPMFRNKRHDYLTSGLPWPQKGPSVPIPLTGNVPVLGIGADNATYATGPVTVRESDGTTSDYATYKTISTDSGDHRFRVEQDGTTGFPNIRADFTDSALGTISALTQAFQIQRLYERDAQGGTRYTEIIRAHWGVVSPDARLQRPEYLGGNSNPVVMHPLAQTSESASTPQGNLAGNGTLIDTNLRIQKAFTEHGYLIGVVSFRGDLSYYQGIDRHWSYKTRFDFPWPALMNIGEQAVLNKEVNALGTADDQDVFSYMPRYDEARYKKSFITSNMRPGVVDSTDYWHLAEEFSGIPALNSDFISSSTPFDRVLQVPTQPTFLCDYYFDFIHARIMPTYGTPGVAGRL